MPDPMPLGQPIPDDPTEPQTGDAFPDLSDADLEKALRGQPVDAAEDEDDDEPGILPTDEPEPGEPAPIAAEATPASEVAPPDEPEKPLTVEDRLAAAESQLRVERLERERAEAVAERERYLHSRNAGEVGYLKKILTDRKAETDSGYEAEATAQQPEIDEIKTEINTLKAERVQQGIAEELNNFHRAYPDSTKDEQALTEIVQRKLPDYAGYLNGTDPKLARTMVRSLLKESYAELRIEREQATRTAAVTQSYDQADRMKARKLSVAPASTTRTAPQRARPKSIDDLTDAEIDALADEHVRNSA